MSLRVRRVVTGHDERRRAVVARDETLPVTVRRPGQEGCVVWSVDRVPADPDDPADGALRATATTVPGGVVFRVVRYEAGSSGRIHRTRSIDYAVILSGDIVLAMDDGVEVELNAGDMLVQRATRHHWINRGSGPCVIAYVLIDAVDVPAADEETPP
jgi:quercetin dioxygenase-like cupin family protein